MQNNDRRWLEGLNLMKLDCDIPNEHGVHPIISMHDYVNGIKNTDNLVKLQFEDPRDAIEIRKEMDNNTRFLHSQLNRKKDKIWTLPKYKYPRNQNDFA